jgi:hypothetical protein
VHEVSSLLVDFSDDTLEISLTRLAVTAKKPDLARRQDAGNIVATLEEEPAADVDEEGACNLMVGQSIQAFHPFDSSQKN